MWNKTVLFSALSTTSKDSIRKKEKLLVYGIEMFTRTLFLSHASFYFLFFAYTKPKHNLILQHTVKEKWTENWDNRGRMRVEKLCTVGSGMYLITFYFILFLLRLVSFFHFPPSVLFFPIFSKVSHLQVNINSWNKIIG